MSENDQNISNYNPPQYPVDPKRRAFLSVSVIVFLALTLGLTSYYVQFRTSQRGKAVTIQYLIQAGLITYWPMDEIGGQAVADSVSGVNGTAVGTTITNGANSTLGRARSFNGSSDRVDFSPSALLDSLDQNLTIEALISIASLPDIPGEDLFPLVEKIGTSAENYRYFLLGAHRNTSSTNGYIQFRLYDGTNALVVNSPPQEITNRWIHVVGSKNGTTASLYLDGQLASSTINTNLGSVSNTHPLEFAAPEFWGYFHGNLDNVRIYSRALTANEVTALYSDIFPPTPSPTLGIPTATPQIIVSPFTSPTPLPPSLTPSPTIPPPTPTLPISSPSPTPSPTTSLPTSSPSCPTRSTGDANCDSTIDGIDYSYWLNSQCHPGPGQICAEYTADFNRDGNVDDVDYQIWYTNRS